MKTAVRYQSRSGNTRKIAESIASSLGVQAAPVGAALGEAVDILFVGGAVYGGKLDKSLSEWLGGLSAEMVRSVAVFSTSARGRSISEHVLAVIPSGINIIGELDCPSRFLFMNRKRPNEEDLAAAVKFTKRMTGSIKRASHC